ncbi:uncharacterized protein BP5553_00888 [Venustampulla echinocandica]|uniref:Uncharacterized protein n=1 Tax=Venustampulla echinocandica TaxID=2656787 RepID=A0A370TZF8_9HELO|nr:uncharacterized protein BP5553_00888 [Venustampulla echinocandica]RDL40909.1 hypothetical protein BP5553_00888 [Venustampulla echinocandica]
MQGSDNGRPTAKRKRGPSDSGSPAYWKRNCQLQQESTCQRVLEDRLYPSLREAKEQCDTKGPTIVHNYSYMSNEVQQITDPNSEAWLSKPRIRPDQKELRKLVGKCWDTTIKPCYNPPAMDHLLKFRLWIAIQAMTTSAILIWVRERESLLEPQLEYLVKCVASRSVTEGAKELAARLIAILGPLFNCLPDTWQETDAPIHIQKAFEYPLRIKADTKLDEEEFYKVLRYQPGQLFNKETMLPYPGCGVQGQNIGLCVQAALFKSDSDAMPSYAASKAIVVFKENAWLFEFI